MASKATVTANDETGEITPFSLIGEDWTEEIARKQAAEMCKVNSNDIEDIYHCTPLQEGLMALSSKVPEAYIAQRVLSLENMEVAIKLRKAFNVAARDCSILRTRIVHISFHGLMQVVLKGSFAWREGQDLQQYLSSDRAEQMGLGIALCRLGLVSDSKTSQVNLVLTMHHALYDGWSMPLIVDRVNRAFHKLEPVCRTPFKSFIKHLLEIQRPKSETYWRGLLAGTTERQCPSLPHPDYQTQANSLLEQYTSVQSNLQSSNTLATLIRAAWALTAAQYSGVPDVVFGETLTGRNADIAGVEEIEAPLITTVPMRVRPNGSTKVSEYLDQIHQQTVDRIPHEQLGLQNIRLLSRDARRACDLRTGFVLHPCAEGEGFDELTKGPASDLVPASDNEAAQEALKFNSYALMLVCTLEKNGFLTMASFDSRTISADCMQELLRQFDEAVSFLSGNPDSLLSDGFKIPESPVDNDSTADKQKENDAAQVQPPETSIMNNRAEVEQHLTKIWSRILRIDRSEIATCDNFFDLGGDSIGAMKLVSELKHQQYELTVAQIFTNRTLRSMAKMVTKSEKMDMPPDTSRDKPDNCDNGVDLERIRAKISSTLSDERWNIEKTYPARPLQTIAVKGTTQVPRYSVRYERFFFEGRMDKPRLFDSCEKLVAMNEILRTVFVTVQDRCFAAVIDKISSPVMDYNIEGEVETFAHLLCDLNVQIQLPEGSSFVKFFYIENEQGHSCLIFRLSHAQYDEMCLPVMLEQLSALYQGAAPKRTLSFSTFVQHVMEESMQTSKTYWTQYLKGSKMSILPGPGDINPDRSKWVSHTKTVPTSKRSKDITLATLPTAAWAMTLARRLNTQDVVFGEVASGRNTGFANADIVMGPCWQYIPFRLKLQESWTHHELLQAVQKQHIESSPFESMGFSEIVQQCTDWPRDTAWFDSVVHQDVAHVEELSFSLAKSRMKTYYPHLEPLREWKFQAFADKDEMKLEIVTFEAWTAFGKVLLDDVVEAFEDLINRPEKLVSNISS